MLKAVIFDMDGVIVDSEPMHFEIDKRVLKKFGIIVDDAILNPYVGVSNTEMWKDLKDKFSLPINVDELIKLQIILKKEVLKETEIDAIPGIRELVNDLVQNRLILGIASSSPRLFINEITERLNIKHFFSTVISGEEVENGKPSPDIFIAAARGLKVDPDECIVIEDSENGVKASVSAGIKCIGYANPNSGRQDLAGASAIVNSITELDYCFVSNILAGTGIFKQA